MISFRARVIKFLMQNRHFFQFRLKEEDIDWSQYESVLKFRKEAAAGAKKLGKLPADIKTHSISIDGMSAEWILLDETNQDKVILYFHGGGYICGDIEGHRSLTAKFVKESGIGALLFEYRLAPENPYPAALDDAVKAYQYLLEEGISASNIVFLGDSAGGGLCLATTLYLRDNGFELPAAVVSYSPMTDLKCTGESHLSKAKVCLSPKGCGEAFAKHYAGDYQLDLPYISPLYGDLRGFPPTLIYVGEDETLRDDSILFAEKAKKAGVDITLRVGEGMFHCFPAMAPLFPEAKKAMEEICIFIKERVRV
ncbi:alpha/beta hydrolase [Natronospora cellulosivora (SeqCode)]